MSKFYTCEEVSERYGVKIRTVWEWVRKKKIPAIKIGKEYRFSDKDLETFEESKKTIKA